MKTLFLSIAAIVASLSVGEAVAQVCNDYHDVPTVDTHQRRSYREGEVIVKFNPQSKVKVSARRGTAVSTAVSSVDAVLNSIGVVDAEQLMPLSGVGGPQRVKAYSGGWVVRDDMSKLYRLRLNAENGADVHDAVGQLQMLDDVEFAEPNYIVYAMSADGDATSAADYTNEPLYTAQWAIGAVNLNTLWTKEKVSDKRPVIAILDTGVDITHPDLADNIWTNELEASGVEDADDDANGYADDLNGWDFVNQTARIGDWNGHGTHVAGIAAAVGNNGVGIAGANPDALIMPITVMQSDGTGDVATIIKGVDYAAANGADVINMSFGGYSYSIAEEQALARAYSTAVLVAAAGNDCRPINIDVKCPICKKTGSPMFPAAFTFVLGVEAGNQDGNCASFSNYDDDGPTFSKFDEEKLYNYELRAPGVSVMSTFPGGKYKELSGTSMASPLVAGAVSRLLQCKEYANMELLFGDLINTCKVGGNVDFAAAYEVTDEDRVPTLQMVAYALVDSVGGDGDSRPDAGETIELWPTLRNEWGSAENISFSLEVAETEDPTVIEILENNVSFGKSLSSYAKAKSENPLRFKINDICVDGRKICLVLRVTCDNIAEELVHDFTIIVENGVEIGGMITEDMTLYPNKHYIVTRTIAVPEGVTLTIMPGTELKFKDGTGFIASDSSLVCCGTPEQPIIFTMAENSYAGMSSMKFGKNKLEYVKFSGLLWTALDGTFIYGKQIVNCVLENLSPKMMNSSYYLIEGDLQRCNVFNNHMTKNTTVPGSVYSNFINNNLVKFYLNPNVSCNAYSSNSFSNTAEDSIPYNATYLINTKPMQYTNEQPCYFGSSREETVRLGIYDMYNLLRPYGFGVYDLSNMLTRPVAEAHGIVWKVVVNGYDAQDEFEQLPPLGVGKHKFEVYFNRPMDVSVAPNIYMGVRPPYTQVAIAEEGEWSADSLIYTSYLTIDGKTSSDGLNRIYVDGARDNEYFDIPVENRRFNVEVAAAGSMSTGLMAEAGLGKVTLTWETDEEDFEDLLGYNIYRYTNKLDSVYTDYDNDGNWVGGHWEVTGDTVTVNESVLESDVVEFVDYDVVPGTTYYYVIKQLTTSLNSHSLSNPVAATPLTAQKGDANGSMAVDVADVVTEVAWLTNQNPQPFIFEAADVNSDGEVNILDIVGTVNIITNPDAATAAAINSTATYTIEDGVLYVDSPVAIGGVQLRIAAAKDTEFTALEGLDGFEQMGDWQNDSEYLFLAFSMTGKSIAPGKNAILRVGDSEVTDVILSDVRGSNMLAVNGNATGMGKIEAMQMQLPYPNPFSVELTVPYIIGQEGNHNVDIVMSDLAGRTIHSYSVVNGFGKHSYIWRPATQLADGLYIVSMYVDGMLMQTAKVIYKK